ncbi:MAG: copper chaperone PCu(A)C [Alphaproteobacteria bacterium]
MSAKRLITSFVTLLVLGALIWVSWPYALKTLDVSPVVVEEAQILAPFKGASMTAGYLTIRSRTSAPLVLKAVKSPAFGRIEIHDTTMNDGVMRMRHVEGLEIPAFSTITMLPGGMHLMAFEPKRGVVPGAPVPMFLEFEGISAPVALVVPVYAR